MQGLEVPVPGPGLLIEQRNSGRLAQLRLETGSRRGTGL